MKILLTGSTGFVGRHLINFLQRNGHNVAVVARKTSDLTNLKPFIFEDLIFKHSGCVSELTKFVSKVAPEVVVHLASLYLTRHKPNDIHRLVESNILFGVQLLESISEAGVKKFINAGTSWQNFNDDEYNPANLYAASKQAFEVLSKYYVEAHGLSIITLKIFDTYGPNDTRKKLINLLKRSAVNGDILKMSPGEQKIDLVHVDDIVRAFLIAIKRNLKNENEGLETFALSSDRPVSLRELVKLIEIETSMAMNVKFSALPYRSREIMEPWKNFISLPGWSPEISLERGIKELFENGD